MQLVLTILRSLVSIVVGLGAVWGAINYNMFAVGLNAFWILIGYVVGIVIGTKKCAEWDDKGYEYTCENYTVQTGGIIVGLAVACLWIYPHVGFIFEVKNGILSAETYEREKFSCCCISSVQYPAVVAPSTIEKPAIVVNRVLEA